MDRLNLPFKTVRLYKHEFRIEEITKPSQYNHDTQFETYFRENQENFRLIVMRIPFDCEFLAKNYFKLSPVNSFEEFWNYSRVDMEFQVPCEYSNWKELEYLDFGYFYIPVALKEIQEKIKQLQVEYQTKLKELKIFGNEKRYE